MQLSGILLSGDPPVKSERPVETSRPEHDGFLRTLIRLVVDEHALPERAGVPIAGQGATTETREEGAEARGGVEIATPPLSVDLADGLANPVA